MEPEETLLLPVVSAGGPVQVKVVDKLLRQVALVQRPVPLGVMRIAVTLRGGVPVVQMDQGRIIFGAEVLPVQAIGVFVEAVIEADNDRLAVFGVDPRARERAVEAVDGARRKSPNGACRVGLARVVKRD